MSEIKDKLMFSSDIPFEIYNENHVFSKLGMQ